MPSKKLNIRGFGVNLLVALLSVACFWLEPAQAQTNPLDSTVQSQSVRPEQFGAVGDGVHDDTDAFSASAKQISANGGGTFELTAGKTYRVGRQYHEDGQYPYYKTAPMFWLDSSKKVALWVVIEGNGAIVKLNDGLRIGSFDKNSGEPYIPKEAVFTDGGYVAQPGTVFKIIGYSSVEIRNVTIDGNISKLITGGKYGDAGFQCQANGIHLHTCDRIRIDNVISSHCGSDGIMLAYYYLNDQSPPQDWAISNSRFEYNARQGMSVVGGKGLTVTNCKFNHTGRERFSSNPKAGVDIEAENSVIRNLSFVSCDFVNNKGCAMVADTGDSSDVTFTNCLFWGTDNYSIWPAKFRFRFYGCKIFGGPIHFAGSPDPELANQFYNCHFEDFDGEYEGKTYTSYRENGLIYRGAKNLLMDGCTFVANKCRGPMLNGPGAVIRNCDFYLNQVDYSNDMICRITSAHIENTRFHEKFGPSGRKYFIQISDTSVGSGVYVDGPQCAWGGIGGGIGLIKNSVHASLQDTTTQGSWKTAYGEDGYDISSSGKRLPSYATVTYPDGKDSKWADSTTEVRALQKADSATDRMAACRVIPNRGILDLMISGDLPKNVAFYLLDWDKKAGGVTVEAMDGESGAVLDTQTVSDFTNGTYLKYTLKGHIKFRFRLSTSSAAVVAGLFFDHGPVVANDAYTTVRDTPLVVSARGVLDNDSEPEMKAMTAEKVSEPANGALVLNTNGGFTFTPSANWTGTSTFNYRACADTASKMATVTITVTPVLLRVVASDAMASKPGSVPDYKNATFRISRSGSIRTPLNVKYAMSGTAVNGTDYAELSGNVTIASNAADAYVKLVPKTDPVGKGDKAATLTLTSDGENTLDATAAAATVTITDGVAGKP